MNIKLLLPLFVLLYAMPVSGQQYIEFRHKTKNKSKKYPIKREAFVHTIYDSANFYTTCKIINLTQDSMTIVHPKLAHKQLTLAFTEIITIKMQHSLLQQVGVTIGIVFTGLPLIGYLTGGAKVNHLATPVILGLGFMGFVIATSQRKFNMVDYSIILIE